MWPALLSRGSRLALASAALVLLAGCETTAVSSGSQFKPNEGLVALRFIDLGDVPLKRFTVQSEQTGEEYSLSAMRFGQTSSMTYVGVLPAGRYRPKTLTGSAPTGATMTNVTVPLENATGRFDIEAGRVTQLGTMVFVKGDVASYDFGSRVSQVRFALPIDPTPVPVEAMLAARFPQLAKTSAGRPPLTWIDGSLPARATLPLDPVRRNVRAAGPAVFTDLDTLVNGGALGTIAKRRAGAKPTQHSANTVHAIHAVLALQDGRWLMGGEQGYLAVSGNQGASWEPLPPMGAEDVVLHLLQKKDGRLVMVTDRDREVVVYESADHPIAWREIRRIPTEREQGLLMKEIGENAEFLPDHAVSSKDKLVIFTHPRTLSTLDLATGQWESHETPRTFSHGLKLTPDGYVVGIQVGYWVFGSTDFGKTWKRLEAWLHMTEPHFHDRRRGVMLAADMSMSGGRTPYQVRTTDDGGTTWKTGGMVKDWHAWIVTARRDRNGRFLKTLWADPGGRLMYSADSEGVISVSRDGGRSWD